MLIKRIFKKPTVAGDQTQGHSANFKSPVF